MYPSTEEGHPTEEEMTELSRFAMRYSVPILIRSRNERWSPDIPGSGGGLLIVIGDKKRLITASHVLTKYREEYVRDAATLFEFGGVPINATRRLLYEDATSDLAVIDLTDAALPTRPNELPAPEFFSPQPWPGNDVVVGDRIFFGGWPGAYRRVRENGMDVFLGYDSILNVPVTGVSDHEFQVKFDRSNWSSLLVDGSTKPKDYVEDRRLGGHSGTPVFRISPTVERPELVGFIKQDRGDDAVICCPVTKIRSDGSIKPSSIGYQV